MTPGSTGNQVVKLKKQVISKKHINFAKASQEEEVETPKGNEQFKAKAILRIREA
jgi:hypothetical protein